MAHYAQIINRYYFNDQEWFTLWDFGRSEQMVAHLSEGREYAVGQLLEIRTSGQGNKDRVKFLAIDADHLPSQFAPIIPVPKAAKSKQQGRGVPHLANAFFGKVAVATAATAVKRFAKRSVGNAQKTTSATKTKSNSEPATSRGKREHA